MLAGRPARYAVNAPLLTPETADALAPYLPLARTLGQLYAQFARGIGALTLEVAGELAGYDAAPLVAAALRGVLEIATAERVTLVNALQLARARGIKLVERRRPMRVAMPRSSRSRAPSRSVARSPPAASRASSAWATSGWT